MNVAFAIPRGWFVYLLKRGSVVVYVGKTGNLLSRLGDHVRGKDFDSFEAIPSTKRDAARLEIEQIKLHKPALNQTTPADVFTGGKYRSVKGITRSMVTHDLSRCRIVHGAELERHLVEQINHAKAA
jgi:hypothetical protein